VWDCQLLLREALLTLTLTNASLPPRSDASQVAQVLAGVNEWQFDTFELHAVAAGRPLSLLAFALLKQSDIVHRFHLDELKLARHVPVVTGFACNMLFVAFCRCWRVGGGLVLAERYRWLWWVHLCPSDGIWLHTVTYGYIRDFALSAFVAARRAVSHASFCALARLEPVPGSLCIASSCNHCFASVGCCIRKHGEDFFVPAFQISVDELHPAR
jgi:hypothetical protein